MTLVLWKPQARFVPPWCVMARGANVDVFVT